MVVEVLNEAAAFVECDALRLGEQPLRECLLRAGFFVVRFGQFRGLGPVAAKCQFGILSG